MLFVSFCLRRFKPTFRVSLARSRCLIVMLCLSTTPFCFATATEAQHQGKQTANLTLTIQPQMQLEKKGANLVLKIRLAPGADAKLWGDNSCGLPKDNYTTFTASGTYQVSVQNLTALGQAYVCAASSDGRLKASIRLQN